jgi:hypothetical protein
VADKKHLIPVSKDAIHPAVGWISIRVRGLRWRNFGLTRNRSWLLTLAFGMGFGLLMEAFELLVSQPVLIRIPGKQPDLSVLSSHLRQSQMDSHPSCSHLASGGVW